MSIFSIIQDAHLVQNAEQLKPSKQIKELAKTAGIEYNRILVCGSKDEPLYMLKPQCQKTLQWINKNILLKLPNDNLTTVGVKLRIATGMLNKLEVVLGKDIVNLMHKRLVDRVKEAHQAIQVEDLPF